MSVRLQDKTESQWPSAIPTVVDWCLANDLKVIINTHHDKWLEGRPTSQYKEENNQKLAQLWMNIASQFAAYHYRVAFAGTNQVHIKDNWGKPQAQNLAVQNSYNQTSSAPPPTSFFILHSYFPPQLVK